MHNSIINSSKRYSRYEMFAISAIFFSDALVMSGKYSIAGTLEWLCVLISALFAVPIILIYDRLIKKKQPALFTKILIVAVSAVSILISLVVFTEFVDSCVLPEVNRFIIPASIFILSAYTASKNFGALSKSTHIIIPIIAIFLIFSLLLIITRIDISNVTYPPRTQSSDMYMAIIVYTLIFAIKGILLLYLFKYEKSRYNNGAFVSIGLIIYGIIMALILITSLSVLGPGLYLYLDFPLYYPLGLTQYGYYFERAEILSLIAFLITLTYKIGLYLRIIKMTVKHDKKGASQETAGKQRHAQNWKKNNDNKKQAYGTSKKDATSET
ncbi:MAG: GerAB/ArcD/ProY family transporter [Firmicutes bacterium]|nr:GerAB/ArcD/ProY family transporter [Bacillota bacterium]